MPNEREHNGLLFPDDKREKLWRIYALILVFAIGLLAIWIRLFIIQVKDSDVYKEIAKRQYESKVALQPTRGCMFDRNMSLLVSNSVSVSYAADPKFLAKDTQFGEIANAVAGTLSGVFGKDPNYYLAKLDTNKKFVVLEKHVSPEQVEELDGWDQGGIIKLDVPERLYHYDNIAGQVIGVTDADNVGVSGIELALNKELAGKDGYVVLQRDGRGRCRPNVDYPRIEPTNGTNVVLTIDFVYQSIAEEELAKGVKKYDAEAGLAMIMDPKTGEILAMANYPTINPNDFAHYEPKAARNRAITDVFEPGSIFKIVVASAAIEEGKKRPTDSIYAEMGTYKVKDRSKPIRDDHPHGWLTFKQAIAVSSNICMAKVSDEVGAETYFQYVRNFGFGTRTGIEFPGELRGNLKRPNEWRRSTLNSMAFGYELAATPVQCITAYSAIANDGLMMKPHIIKREIDWNGNVIKEIEPQAVRRVVSAKTAKTMTDMFIGVVEKGTGTLAQIDGVKIAGKTGTSKKIEKGHYSSKHMASFIGYFPADDPRFVCMVVLDSPKKESMGGRVAAPIFRNIAERIINTAGLPTGKPDVSLAENDKPDSISVPDVCELRAEVAERVLKSHGLKSEKMSSKPSLPENGIIVHQSPEPGVRVERRAVVQLLVLADNEMGKDGFAYLPDVRGMSIRRAVNRLSVSRIEANVLGSGVVASQSPYPGEQVRLGSKCVLYCKPQTAEGASLY
jgi:cell division protein FtsI (penicillin-binding protein 3)